MAARRSTRPDGPAAARRVRPARRRAAGPPLEPTDPHTRHPALPPGRFVLPASAPYSMFGALPLELGAPAELTTGARPLLLDLTEDASLSADAAGWAKRVDAVPARFVDAATPVRAVLIRPDGYVAWATNSSRPTAQERDALRAALTGWFGRPVGTHTQTTTVG